MAKLLQVSPPSAQRVLPRDPDSNNEPPPEQRSISEAAEELQTPERPSLEQLQKAYASAIGRRWVKQQLQQHPEWGYEIIDNQVQPSLPF